MQTKILMKNFHLKSIFFNNLNNILQTLFKINFKLMYEVDMFGKIYIFNKYYSFY